MASEILLKDDSAPTPRIKPPPHATKIPVPFAYTASDDGTDENLLILLHGLGDTHTPFGNLGRNLKLPQTATLALRAPQQIPYLDEKAYQWYPSFDALGEIITRPNPTSALDLLQGVLDHLISDCTWAPQRIHLFGFAQGGSVAVEGALKFWRAELARASAAKYASSPDLNGMSDSNTASEPPPSPAALGSIVTVSGPLLSHPTLSTICPTPVLVFHRSVVGGGNPGEFALSSGDLASFRKGYGSVKEVKLPGAGMPRSRDEWRPIMEFWSERLRKRPVERVYEVLSGIAPAP